MNFGNKVLTLVIPGTCFFIIFFGTLHYFYLIPILISCKKELNHYHFSLTFCTVVEVVFEQKYIISCFVCNFNQWYKQIANILLTQSSKKG